MTTAKKATPKAETTTATVVKKPKTAAAAPKEKPSVEKKAAVKATSKKKSTVATVTPEQRSNYVEIAAYYIAERRSFTPGDPLADWAEAEAEIDRLLATGRFGS